MTLWPDHSFGCALLLFGVPAAFLLAGLLLRITDAIVEWSDARRLRRETALYAVRYEVDRRIQMESARKHEAARAVEERRQTAYAARVARLAATEQRIHELKQTLGAAR